MAELYVWVNMKNWGIERHQVDFLYGREHCQYYNQLWNVQPPESLFYLEWLPKRILDMLDEEYELTVSDEPPSGLDEFIGKDKFIHIKGASGGENQPENSNSEAETEDEQDN